MRPWIIHTGGAPDAWGIRRASGAAARGAARRGRAGARRGGQWRRCVAAASIVMMLGFVLSAATSSAHDFWIEPETFRPTRSPVAISLRIGDAFPGEPFPRDPSHVLRFVVVGAEGESAIAGHPGVEPAGLAPIRGPGLHVVGYQSRPRGFVLEGAAFDAYVAKEALAPVIAARAGMSAPEAPVHELFSRYAKSLLWLDGPGAGGADAVLGFPLELVAETNPYATRPGDPIGVRLLYRGRPIEGAQVGARSPTDPEAMLKQRTDADGRVVFRLPRAGSWLLRAIHMVPAPAGSDVDWESLWASLTFAISANPIPPFSPILPGS